MKNILSVFAMVALLASCSASGLPDSVEIIDDQNRTIVLERSGSTFTSDNIEVSFTKTQEGLAATLHSPSVKVKYVRAIWNEPAREGSLYLGDQWERGYGDLRWEKLGPSRIMPWYYIESTGGKVYGRGVMTGCRSFCAWKVSGSAVELTFDVRNGSHGVDLGERELEMAVILDFEGASGENEYSALHRFCKVMCPNPRLPKSPVYGVNDWYFAYGHNSSDLIASTAVMLSPILPDSENRPFFLIDDGWARKWYDDGDYDYCGPGGFHTSNDRFPDMKALADRLRDAGFRPGLWMRPLSAWMGAPEEMLLAGYEEELPDRYFDPTVESVREYIRKCFATYREWGYEMVKHDFTTFDMFRRWGHSMIEDGDMTKGDWQFHDTTKTNAEVVLQLYHDIRDAAGDGISLIGCNTISHLGAGIFEIQRIGDDTSGREWFPTVHNGVNCIAFRAAQHDAFYAIDADCVAITKKVEWRLSQRWLQLVAESGTPLFVSPQPEVLGPEQMEALKKSFDIASKPQATCEPLDWMETRHPARWTLLGREVSFDWEHPEE
ncbi:MAG: hypothetical protein MJY70_03155 [Bacteroidales bacterium]|nr:hypothetical protein [Bacteroidales bacterium]